MRLFNKYEISIKKIKKEKPFINDNILKEKALDKYLGKIVTIMGLCGDVEEARVMQYNGITHETNGRYVHFITDNDFYSNISYHEKYIV